MADPTVIVEVAFDSTPGTEPADVVWTDVSCDVRAVTTTRGRNQELAQFAAGRATVTLSNADRKYDPTNDYSVYAGKILPMKKARIRSNQQLNALVATNGSVSTPDSADISLTGDMTIEFGFFMEDWTDFSGLGSVVPFLQKSIGGTTDYMIRVYGDGRLEFYYGGHTVTSNNVETIGFPPNTSQRFRVSLDANNGGGNSSGVFQYLNDANVWTSLGSFTDTIGGATDTAGADLYVGGPNGTTLPGITYFWLYSGYIGAASFVTGVNFEDYNYWPEGASAGFSVNDYDHDWTINGDASIQARGSVIEFPIFEGFADTWEQQNRGPNDAVAVLQLTDGFKVLEGTNIDISAFGLEVQALAPKVWFRLDEPQGSASVTDSVSGVQATVNGDGDLGVQGLLNFDSNSAYSQSGQVDNDDDFIISASVGVVTSGVQGLLFNQDGTETINAVTTPDHASLDGFTTSLDIRVRLTSPGATGYWQFIFGKGGYTTQQGYTLAFAPNGAVSLEFTDTAGLNQRAYSDMLPASLFGVASWIAAAVDIATGTVSFYSATVASPNASLAHADWTPRGATVFPVLPTGMEANALLPTVGARGATSTGSSSTGSSRLQGLVHAVQLRGDGTLVASPTFTDTGQWTAGEDVGDTGTDAQGKVWTIRQVGGVTPVVVGASVQPFSFSTVVQYVAGDDADVFTDRTILQQGSTSSGPFWRLYLNSSGFAVFEVNDGAGTDAVVTSTTNITSNSEIHHIVGTYTAGGLASIYVDGGAAEDTDTGNASMTSTFFVIGQRRPSVTGSNWSGKIDEVLLFDRALSAAEADNLFVLTTTPWANDSTGTRIERLLDAAFWPQGKRDVDFGDAEMQSTFNSGSALSLARNVADSELFGSLFISNDGDVRFIMRQNHYNKFDVANFGDNDPSYIPFGDLTPEYGDWLIRNDVTIERNGGVQQRVRDLSSIGSYLPHSASWTGLNHNSDELSLLAAQKVIEQYSQPVLRLSAITVYPRKAIGVAQAALPIELGDWVTTHFTPQDQGDEYQITSVVEQITHSISNGSKTWITTFSLSPAPVDIDPVAGTGDPSPPPTGQPGPTTQSLDARVTELESDVAALEVAVGDAQDDIDDHIADTTDAHDASAISFSPVGTIAATDAQTAIAEVATDAASALSAGLGTKQNADATLTALAAYNTNGLVTQTAADTFTGRTLTAGVHLGVSNGNGVSGNPTVSLDDTGWVTAGFSAATNFTATKTRYRLLGDGLVCLEVQMERTAGGAITVPASGNISNTSIVTIPAAARPAESVWGTWVSELSFGTCLLPTSGTISLRTAAPGTTMPQNEVYIFHCVYYAA